VRDKTIDHCKKLANSEKNEINKLENELKYLEELSNTLGVRRPSVNFSYFNLLL
jgi:archaellum component FlaC